MFRALILDLDRARLSIRHRATRVPHIFFFEFRRIKIEFIKRGGLTTHRFFSTRDATAVVKIRDRILEKMGHMFRW
jgi:hypothetical protein